MNGPENVAGEQNVCSIDGLNFTPEWSGTHIYFKSLPVADYASTLYQEELPAIAKAAPMRRNTFSSGRHCARALLHEIGLPEAPLVRGSDGSVRWPPGLIGSISHTNDWAVAAIAVPDTSDAQQLGIDLERIKPLEEGVIRLIASGAELEELSEAHLPPWHAMALFSLKESLYKCLASDYGEFINFHDVEITALATGIPSLRFTNKSLARRYAATRLELRMAVTPHHVFTLIWLRNP